MNWLSAVVILYGLLNLGFGILGYVNSGSVASLIAGGAAGVLAIFGGTLAKTHPKIGFGIVAVIALALMGRFAKGTFSGTIYPAGILFAASAIVFVCLVVGHFLQPKSPPAA